jgi:hypothetical protein
MLDLVERSGTCIYRLLAFEASLYEYPGQFPEKKHPKRNEGLKVDVNANQKFTY